MRQQASGAIVNCSLIGGLVGGAERSVYHAAKHGVLGIVELFKNCPPSHLVYYWLDQYAADPVLGGSYERTCLEPSFLWGRMKQYEFRRSICLMNTSDIGIPLSLIESYSVSRSMIRKPSLGSTPNALQ